MQSIPSASARILAIEDDPLLASHLHEHLRRRGFDVTLRQSGEEGLALASSEDFDLILMDILLPGRNGLEVLGALRRERKVPVILMSALGAEQDRIAGFSQGADDYLPKPFSMSEMEVRIDAVLRRVAYERDEVPWQAEIDPQLLFDEGRADVRLGTQWAGFTPTEYRLLETLLHHEEEVLSKAFLYQQVLHRPYARHDRVLDMHVSHIRRKLKGIGYNAGRVETVWGKGYVLTRAAS
ncbi:response regulator transcription factor [Zestomonas carbonaria]|uniref:Transcriptional regulatory protein BaeR n=1 Tax=Zestomonas carbonaria TaxID=2762745 RepID=A0A7U7I7M4_9GAMM|nr:response regulator transcription factor [Pseudomonas carbonaria]CAD5106404.1 Transcriptional regulatory protein BaeR [Pseudomonas carbonaria]